MSLMQQIKDYRVPKGSVALWWLGQNGYIFKTPEGTIAASTSISPTVARRCRRRRQIDLKRRVPVLIEPEELEVDLFACTHNHMDHTDPETHAAAAKQGHRAVPRAASLLRNFPGRGDAKPAASRRPGRSARRSSATSTFAGTFALPTDTSDLNHMGFSLQFGDGPSIYMTGDTDYTDLLHEAARTQPDLMITCINGGFNNLSHWEAAQLAKQVKPKVAIPCHYDMFGDNSAIRSSLRRRCAYSARGALCTDGTRRAVRVLCHCVADIIEDCRSSFPGPPAEPPPGRFDLRRGGPHHDGDPDPRTVADAHLFGRFLLPFRVSGDLDRAFWTGRGRCALLLRSAARRRHCTAAGLPELAGTRWP